MHFSQPDYFLHMKGLATRVQLCGPIAVLLPAQTYLYCVPLESTVNKLVSNCQAGLEYGMEQWKGKWSGHCTQ